MQVQKPLPEMCQLRVVHPDESSFQNYSSSGEVLLPREPNSNIRSLSYKHLKSHDSDVTDLSSNDSGASSGSVRSSNSKSDSNSNCDF